MKFLVNKSYIIILLLFSGIILSSECINIWHESNLNKIQNDLIIINARVYPHLKKKNIDSLKVYIDKINSKIKIELSDQVLLFDKEKSMKLFKEKKQLYIDSPDSSMFILLSSIFNLENIELVKKNKTQYKLKLDSNFDKIRLNFSEDCFYLESIRLAIEKFNIVIDNISFEPYNKIDSLDVFKIQGDYLSYDLRK